MGGWDRVKRFIIELGRLLAEHNGDNLEFFKIGMFRTNCETCTTFATEVSLLWVPVGKNYTGT